MELPSPHPKEEEVKEEEKKEEVKPVKEEEKKEVKREKIVISEDVMKEIKKEIKKEEKKEEVKPAKEEEKEGVKKRVTRFYRPLMQTSDKVVVTPSLQPSDDDILIFPPTHHSTAQKLTSLPDQAGDDSKCIAVTSRIDPQTKLPAPDTAAASHDSLPAVDGVQKEYTKTPTLFGSRDHSISVCNNGVSITMHVEHTAEMAVVRIKREGWYASFTDLTDCETSVCVKFMDRTYMIPTLMKTTLDDFKACVIRVGEAKNDQS